MFLAFFPEGFSHVFGFLPEGFLFFGLAPCKMASPQNDHGSGGILAGATEGFRFSLFHVDGCRADTW